jgi:long-subunit fatty acid transport protein
MRRLGRVSLGFLACLTASTALAQGPDFRHFYLGVDVGRSDLDGSGAFDGVVDLANDDATVFSLELGYRFNRNFSIAAGYADLGEYDGELSGACIAVLLPGPCPSFDTRTSIDGFMVSAVGTWPVSTHFQFTANAGAFYREAELSYPVTAGGLGKYSEKGTVWKFGVGMVVPINDRFDVGLDLTQYRNIGIHVETAFTADPHTASQGDATVVTLGVHWSL